MGMTVVARELDSEQLASLLADPSIANDLILDEDEDGSEDDGYGPPRLLEPDIVREVAEALGVVTDAELRARFDPEEMQRLDIYPQIWEESDILDEYLLPNVQQLRDFYVRAAAHDAAVLIVVQ